MTVKSDKGKLPNFLRVLKVINESLMAGTVLDVMECSALLITTLLNLDKWYM